MHVCFFFLHTCLKKLCQVEGTVEPLYYGHQGDRNKYPYYRGVHFREVGFISISVSQGPSELSVIESCPYSPVIL